MSRKHLFNLANPLFCPTEYPRIRQMRCYRALVPIWGWSEIGHGEKGVPTICWTGLLRALTPSGIVLPSKVSSGGQTSHKSLFPLGQNKCKCSLHRLVWSEKKPGTPKRSEIRKLGRSPGDAIVIHKGAVTGPSPFRMRRLLCLPSRAHAREVIVFSYRWNGVG